MKRKLVILGSLVASLFLSLPVLAGGPSYVMICKGGGGMWAKFYRVGMVYAFAKGGTRAASPAPGECVWIDRGMRPGEVSQGKNIWLWFPPSLFGNSDLIERVSVGQGKIYDPVFTNSKVKQIFDAIYYGKTFYVHARRAGKGGFEVTKIGP